MAKRGTKAFQQEYVFTHYGISHRTFDVRTVWESRDGRLHGWFGTHLPLPGRPAISELMVLYDLFEIRTLPFGMDATQTVEALKAIAAERNVRDTHTVKEGGMEGENEAGAGD